MWNGNSGTVEKFGGRYSLRDFRFLPRSRKELRFRILTLEDGTYRLSRNVGKELPLLAA
jgi:hypothetical protein